MRRLSTLLMTLDFASASQAVVAVSARLARAFGSCVTPLHVIEVDADSALVDVYLGQRDRGRLVAINIEPMLAAQRQEGVDFAPPILASGRAAQQILNKADEIDADLIVVGTGEPRRGGSFCPGPIAEAVIHQARQPVLAVCPKAPKAGFRQILCPFDGSPTSLRGLRNAVRLAQAFQSQLTVLSVVPELPPLPGPADSMAMAKLDASIADGWEQKIAAALGEVNFGDLSWSKIVAHGRPSREILNIAVAKRIDLIVMGATGRSGVTRLHLGITARRILQRMPCSLLIVHDDDVTLEDLNTLEVQTNNLLFTEANQLLANCDYETALRRFDQVLARNPFHVPALEGRASACEALGYSERAAGSRRRAEILRHETWI